MSETKWKIIGWDNAVGQSAPIYSWVGGRWPQRLICRIKGHRLREVFQPKYDSCRRCHAMRLPWLLDKTLKETP